MLPDTDNEEQRLCCDCVGEDFLRSKIQREGQEADCSYCGGHAKTFSIGELANEVEIAIKEHFYRTATEPSGMENAMMKEGDYDWDRKGDPITDIIEECTVIEREPAEDIQKALYKRHHTFDPDNFGEEDPFDEEAHYAEADVDVAESHASWSHFEKTLKTKERYFSRTAEATLTSIFDGIADHKTRDGKPVIVEAGPGKELAAFYRARVFQSDEKLEEALKRPDKDIGPPPPRAATAGRMNAHGISVFYGATDAAVALAEVRPPVGSKAVVGRFQLLRPVKLLDVEALRKVNMTGSIFDREFLPRLQRGKFLKWLSQRITMPIMPDDEPLEYLATQAVADFLATNANPPLDGILYPSGQRGRGDNSDRNVVLFHKAARVKLLNIPNGTEIKAHLYEHNEDGIEIYPWVWEEVPPKANTQATNSVSLESEGFLAPEPLDLPDREEYDYERREPTLELDTSDLQVHEVKAVEFETESHSVHRHRVEKQEREAPF